jgi:hypothetical protein
MPNLPFTMRFGAYGDYRLWAGEGWHDDPNDKEHAWAGHVAKLRVMLEYAKADLLLQIDVMPVQAKGIVQELYIFLNGKFVAFWPVSSASELSARLEAGFLTPGENQFTFVAPKAICPNDLGMGTDQRILGLAFRSFSLSVAP